MSQKDTFSRNLVVFIVNREATMNSTIRFIVILGILLGSLSWAKAEDSLINTNDSLFSSNEYAIDGYDVVAYFNEGKAVKGSEQFKVQHKGVQFYFSSEANQAAFKESPEKYEPQYGGYCAYAVSKGSTAGVDPTVFDVVDGKLYLNYNKDVQKKWRAEMKKHIQRADANWPKVLK